MSGPVQTSIFIQVPINAHLLSNDIVRRLIQTLSLFSGTQFIFTIFNGLKCSQVKLNFISNLCIRFGTWEVRRLKQSRSSSVEIPMWATRSTQIRCVEINLFKRRSFHVLN